MIPRTYPTTYVTANGKQQMVVFFLSSVSGLQRFKDYIPVSFPQYGNQKDNSYDNSGVVLVDVLSSSSGRQAWKDYIPVFVESNAADAWRVSINGYIPVGLATAPTLALDFTSSSQTLDPRITFSRTSNATVTDSSGTLRFAPHNLLTFSEQFDNAAWTKTASSISSNTIIAPDGTLTGDKLVEDTSASTTHQLQRSSSVTSGTSYIYSIYAKAAERSRIRISGGAAAFGSNEILFNLSTETVTVTNGTPTGSIVAVGNGWYRCSWTATATATTTPNFFVYLDDGSAINYTGNGTSGIFIWGAQLNVSNMVGGVTSSLSTYYPTTVKNLLGFSEDFANAAWTKSNSFIQTNLLTWSQDFDNAAWSKNDLTVSANTTIAPDGTTTADKLAASGGAIDHIISNTAAGTSGVVYTFSGYAKAAEVNQVRMRFAGSGAFTSLRAVMFTLSGNGTASVQSGTVNASITSVGDGWYRCSITATADATGTITARFSPATGNASDYNNNGAGIYAWGAQLVQGSTPGDYQQSFSAAAPVMYRAPNGTLTADKLVEDTANSAHLISAGTPTVGQPQTFSIYAKAAERSRISIAGGGFTGQGFNAFFDLSNGTMALNAGNKGSITAVGGGWYRCAISFTPSNTVAYQVTLSDGTTTTYTGNGTSGVYIWGAQLSDSASLDTYVNNPGAAPSSVAYYGPRFDYNPTTLAPRGLLIEEQRTNSIRNNTMQGAVAGNPGTTPTNWFTFTSLTGLTREIIGTGTENGINYIDIKLSGTPSAAGQFGIYFEGNTGIAASNGQTWSQSAYLKLQSGSFAGITDTRLQNDERSSTAYIRSNASNPLTITSAALNTQRFSYTATLTGGATVANILPYVIFNLAGTAIDVTLRIGLPQMEQGAFATSVIPTTTAAATRNADVASITGSNFSGFYNQNEGTLFGESSVIGFALSSTFPNTVSVSDGTSNNRVNITSTNVGSNLYQYSEIQALGSAQASFYGATSAAFGVNSPRKSAVAYKFNDSAFTTVGLAVQTDTSCTIPVVNLMSIGTTVTLASSFLNGHIRKIAYYPKRLTNAEIQSITA